MAGTEIDSFSDSLTPLSELKGIESEIDHGSVLPPFWSEDPSRLEFSPTKTNQLPIVSVNSPP